MPNAKVLSEKQTIVAALAERLQNASAGVFVDYRGINVAEDTALRAELRKNEVEYSVVKNTLTRFAIKQAGFESLDPILNGTTSLATGTGDPIAPIRIISEYAKKMNDKFEIKAGFMEGRVLSLEEISELASLPSKEALYSRVLGTMLAPITSLAIVLAQILEQRGGSAEDSAEPEAPAEAEAPVAEVPAVAEPDAPTDIPAAAVEEAPAEVPAAEPEAPAEVPAAE